MKKITYLLLAGATFYLAGMFRYQSLMVLAGMEILLFVACFFQTRYFKRSLDIEAVRHSDVAGKNMPLVCRFKTRNRGKLPISRFRARYQCGYRQCPEKAEKWVYGGSGRGENILDFEICFRYCGMAYLKMDKVKLYDYLSLFEAAQKKREEMEVAVFPGEGALRIEAPDFGSGENVLQQEQAARRGQDAHNEVRYIREYRAGDSNRYIHWKQSAHMDGLLVKEYEKETDYQAELFLDMDGFARAGLPEQDAFYELLSALVLGLLRNAATVRVYWYDGRSGRIVEAEAADINGCRDMLERLYRLEFDRQKQQDAGKAALERCIMLRGSVFRLNLELCWYWNDLLVYQFSRENLEDEIEHKLFVL